MNGHLTRADFFEYMGDFRQAIEKRLSTLESGSKDIKEDVSELKDKVGDLEVTVAQLKNGKNGTGIKIAYEIIRALVIAFLAMMGIKITL